MNAILRLDVAALTVNTFTAEERGGVVGYMPATRECPTAFACATNGGVDTCGACNGDTATSPEQACISWQGEETCRENCQPPVFTSEC